MSTTPYACPKCRSTTPGAVACPKCGLRNARMPDYVTTARAAVDPAVVASWEALLAGWSDAKRHEAFAQVVANTMSFGWAIERLDAHRASAPDDAELGARVAATQERIRKVGAVRTMVTNQDKLSPAVKPSFKRLGFISLMLLVLLGAGLFLAYRFGSSQRGGMPEAKPMPPVRPAVPHVEPRPAPTPP